MRRLCTILLVGCGGSPGLGSATGTPVGSPYALPAGITLDSPIRGEAGPSCTPQEESGSGGLVAACFTLGNSGAADVAVSFPPLLTFVSRNDVVQNGLVLEDLSVGVPAGGARTIRLGLYCLNQHRTPSGPTDTYGIGPVSSYPGLESLAALLAGRSQDGSSVLVQEAVWEVTDEDGLTPVTRDALKALPGG